MACACIEEIQSRGKLPIVVGGTNYYIESLLYLNKQQQVDFAHPDSSAEAKHAYDSKFNQWKSEVSSEFHAVLDCFHEHLAPDNKQAIEDKYSSAEDTALLHRLLSLFDP